MTYSLADGRCSSRSLVPRSACHYTALGLRLFCRTSRFPFEETALRTLGDGTRMAETDRARSLNEMSERLEELRRHL